MPSALENPAPTKSKGRRRLSADVRDLTIQRRSLHDPVADHLRKMIIRGELGPGDKVPIQALAEMLGVSITPLREALKVLAEDQLVELLPNRGARVLPYTIEESRALFEVIANLEGLAAELAASRISKPDLSYIQALHARMRVHFERSEKEPYFELNSQIHDAVVQASGNEVLIGARAKLNVRATRGRYLAIVDASRWKQAMEEHEDLMESLRTGDAPKAFAIWKTHLRRTGEAVQRAQSSTLSKAGA
jgi:DNA-binding GntR family transcriptional regulator